MSTNREKEINYLLYLKHEIIKQAKKEIKQLNEEKSNLHKRNNTVKRKIR